MFFRDAAIWAGLLGALGVRAACPINSTDYKVTSQADADALNLCEIFNGTITVEILSPTGLISIPGVKNITGSLWIGAADFQKKANMSISMQSLAYVGGTLEAAGISNLVTLDFPALASVGRSFQISWNPNLSTVSLPNLTSVGTLSLRELPSLNALNFENGLSNITGYNNSGSGIVEQDFPSQITIRNTALNSIEGLVFRDISGLSIINNPLENLTLSLETLSCGSDSIEISRNYKMNLNLPNLTTISCGLISLDDVSALDIPSLSRIDGSIWFSNLALATFSAPKLLSVSDFFNFDLGDVQKISLPALQTVGQGFSIEGVPACSLENGILLPNITDISKAVIHGDSGHQAYCQEFDYQRCRGLFTGDYSCNDNDIGINSDPDMCQYNSTTYEWTRTTKIEVGLSLSLGPLVLLGIILLILHNMKTRRAEIAIRASENVELKSAEQLPKYSPHDDSSVIVPPYKRDSPPNTCPEGVSADESDMASVVTPEGTHDDVRSEALDALLQGSANSIPVSPLEETVDKS